MEWDNFKSSRSSSDMGKEQKEDWSKAHAIYDRSNTGGGKWSIKKVFLHLGQSLIKI